MERKRLDIQRREFLKIGSLSVASLAMTSRVATSLAQDKGKGEKPAPHLDEKDPQAAGLGYRHDASKVDKKKYTQYQAGQTCSNCQQFQGKPGDAWGGCQIFVGKQVNAKGWCSAYTKKT